MPLLQYDVGTRIPRPVHLIINIINIMNIILFFNAAPATVSPS